MQHTKSFHKGHPKPQFYRPKYQVLDGEWDFYFDSEKNEKQSIIVPYSYGSSKSGITTREVYDKVIYIKKFKKPFNSPFYILHFDGIDYISKVYLNGKLLGTHKGGYDGFSFRLSNLEEENELRIIARDNRAIDTIRGKQTWRYSPFECFYFNTIGIYKSVWIEGVDDSYIESIKMDPSYQNKELVITANVFGDYDHIDIEVDGRSVSFRKHSVIKITKPRGWSVDNPYLYNIKLELIKDGVVKDTVLSYFGFNDVACKDKFVFLNGRKTFLKLVLDQGYSDEGELTLSENEMIQAITLMKQAGFIGARKHQKIEPEIFYYYCDILGYLLWEELPSPHEYSSDMIEEVKQQYPRIISEHYNHPCVIANVIFNESWGIQSISRYKEIRDEVRNLYDFIKSLVPNRLVITNDGWEHTKSDIVGVHNYERGYDNIKDFYINEYQNLNEHGNARANSHRTIFVPEFKYGGEPFMLTEFGGIALIEDAKGEAWGYGKAAANIEDFLRDYKDLILAIKDSRVFSGFCFTQVSDVQQEVNGLLNKNYAPKVELERIKVINDLIDAD